MRLRTGWVLLALIVLLAGGYLVSRYPRPPRTDREQIQRLILKGARALEQRRVKTFMTIVADDYHDGTYTKREIESLARSAVLEAGEIRIVPYLRSLDLSGAAAQAVVEVEVTLGRPRFGAAAGEPAHGRYTVHLALAQGPRGWQVTSARGWQSAPGELGTG